MKIASPVVLLVLAVLSECAIAQFNDQGFVTAKVRTDYNSQTEGLSSNPLTYITPCLFPPAEADCGNSPTVFSANNWFVQNVTGYPSSSYWVLGLNNEYSYNMGSHSTFNPGPANQSIARSAPGYGIMGFTAFKDLPTENFYRAHLVANGTFPNPNGGLGIPYLAIGSERARGNNSIAPGAINSAAGKKRVQFKAKLHATAPPSALPGGHGPSLVFYVTARTTWGGKGRGVQISLYHWGLDNSTVPPAPVDFVEEYEWNWPMQESYYHPGVEWAFMDAEDVQYFCGFSIPSLTASAEVTYDINLQSLFSCLSTLNAWDAPMPASTLLIEGVHWAVEMSGSNGAIWTSVRDMKMVQ